MQLTPDILVRDIGQLSKNRLYRYVNPTTRGVIVIVRVDQPEGPIVIKRFDSAKGETLDEAKEETISTKMLWRIANAFTPGRPINFDRVLAGSYNTRSVLESLVAYTPQFYYCYPGRIESTTASVSVRRGHKHLVWLPNTPHVSGSMEEFETSVVISEIPNVEAVYDSLILPDQTYNKIDAPDVQRRHAQIQVALVQIGQQLGFRSWVAQNDKGIKYKGRPVGEMEEVIQSLADERVVSPYDEALEIGKFVDCIWFRDTKYMPAVMEIEHTTGITSGLTRMKKFHDACPSIMTRYVIVASDDQRHRVIKESARDQFRDLQARFFPYSAVEELYSLTQRRRIRGVNEEFLDSFMELPQRLGA